MSRLSTSPSPDRKATSNPSPAGGVQSVNRALDVLEFIGSRHPVVPIGEIATGLRLPLPTVHRLLATLSERATRGNCRLVGTRWDFASCHSQSLLALSSARSPSASFSISSTNPVRRQILRFLRAIRPSTVDRHSTGVGKALLSQLGSAHVDDLLDRRGLPGRTEHTITSRVRLHAELERIRSAGFAIDEQEQELGVRCVAVPIAGLSSGMAVSVSGPVTRMTESLVESTVPLLQSAARALAGSLERSD
jgi:IclR family acetate operon transcriptional repressor